MFQFELPGGAHQEYPNITEALANNFLVCLRVVSLAYEIRWIVWLYNINVYVHVG